MSEEPTLCNDVFGDAAELDWADGDIDEQVALLSEQCINSISRESQKRLGGPGGSRVAGVGDVAAELSEGLLGVELSEQCISSMNHLGSTWTAHELVFDEREASADNLDDFREETATSWREGTARCHPDDVPSVPRAVNSFDSDIEREQAAMDMGLDLQEYKIKLAAAKVIGGFTIREKGTVELERSSVYGAVILMPQLARTSGWPRYMTILVIESYLFLFVNFIVQGGLLYMIAKDQNVMGAFSGRMFLCDFGAGVGDCVGHSWCRGPGGTETTPHRLRNWVTFSNRNFARDSMKALFPDRESDIHDKVDPGEYGVESYHCRWICCFIFVMSVMAELIMNYKMLKLIVWATRTGSEPWIDLRDGDDELDWLQSGRIRLAGMSIGWKFVNLVVVWIPKVLLWKLTAEAGIVFLMETSTISEIIINSVALTFVLRVDEMFFELMSDSIRCMLTIHEEIKDYDEFHEESMSEADIMEKHCEKQRLRYWSIKDWITLLPFGLVSVSGLTVVFICQYYYQRCQYAGGGHFVSQAMHLPKSTVFSIFSAFFRSIFPNPSLEQPYWSMPPEET